MKKAGRFVRLMCIMTVIGTLSTAYAQNVCGLGVYRHRQSLRWEIQPFINYNSFPQLNKAVSQFQGLDPRIGEIYELHDWDYNENGYVAVAHYKTRQKQMIFSIGKGKNLVGAISDAVNKMFDSNKIWDVERGPFPGHDHYLHFSWVWSGRVPTASANEVWDAIRGQIPSQPSKDFNVQGQVGTASCWVITPFDDKPTPVPKPDAPPRPEGTVPDLTGIWVNQKKMRGDEVEYRVLIGDGGQGKYHGYFLMRDDSYDQNNPDFRLNIQPDKYRRDEYGTFYTLHNGDIRMPYRPFTSYNPADFEVYKDYIHIKVQAVGGGSYDLLRWRK